MPMSNAPSISRMTGLMLTLAALALGCVMTTGASAQLLPVEPYYVTTTSDNVPLKSGDMDGYYDIAALDQGQVLWVDAEGQGWARVAYPPGVPVYVPAAHVEPTSDDGVLRLARSTTLKSPNTAAGFAQSWQRAIPRGMESGLPIGSRLRVIETFTNASGETEGYAVEAPAPVRAFVKVASLRPATDDEVQAYLANAPAERQTRAQADPQPEEHQPAVADAGTDLTDEQMPVANDPIATDDSQETDSTEVAAQPEAESGDVVAEGQPEDVTTIDLAPADPTERRIGTLQILAETFDRVQQQPSETAELDELAAEFRRAISAQGDDPASLRIRDALQGRLELVQLRIDLRDKRRELRERREQISASTQALASQVSELERTRGYAFVGRLVESSVYDGERLPLMYRIVSISGLVPRTIGYVRPEAEFVSSEGSTMRGKLGEIVGILGNAQFDEALQLRIVTPSRIDVLSAATALEPAD